MVDFRFRKMNELDISNLQYRFGRGAYLGFRVPNEQVKDLDQRLKRIIDLERTIKWLEAAGKGFKFYSPQYSNGVPIIVAMRHLEDDYRGITSVRFVPASKEGELALFLGAALNLGLNNLALEYAESKNFHIPQELTD